LANAITTKEQTIRACPIRRNGIRWHFINFSSAHIYE
jgi:hypothetical protein